MYHAVSFFTPRGRPFPSINAETCSPRQFRLSVIESVESAHPQRERARNMEHIKRSDVQSGCVFPSQFEGLGVGYGVHGTNDQGSGGDILMEEAVEFVDLGRGQCLTMKTEAKGIDEFELTEIRKNERRTAVCQDLLGPHGMCVRRV